MSFVDVAIPGIIGFVLLIWPQSMFVGSRVTPDPKKLRLLRSIGAVLLLVAVIYLAIKLVTA
jgi:hypothetical protein